MLVKNGNQHPTLFDTVAALAGRADTHTGKVEVFGVTFDVVNGTLRKRDFKRLLAVKADLGDRQARAAVSSYWSEDWMDGAPGPAPRLNDWVIRVSSAAHCAWEHAERAPIASASNLASRWKKA